MQVIARHTSKTVEEVAAFIERNNYMTPTEGGHIDILTFTYRCAYVNPHTHTAMNFGLLDRIETGKWRPRAGHANIGDAAGGKLTTKPPSKPTSSPPLPPPPPPPPATALAK